VTVPVSGEHQLTPADGPLLLDLLHRLQAS